MAGFECVSKYHYGDRHVGDLLYKYKPEDKICLDCYYCEKKRRRVYIPKTHVIQALAGVSSRTARRKRAAVRDLFKDS